MENVYGVVTKVRFYNNDTGFGIIIIKLNYQDKALKPLQEKLYTNQLAVTCSFDKKPIIDEEFSFDGEFTNNPQYGYQFKASRFTRLNETTKEAVVNYLSGEDFQGIGVITAAKVYDTLGSDCLNEIIKCKDVLDKVDGLNDVQKNIIYEALVLNDSNKKTIIALMNFKITLKMAKKIINAAGLNCMDIINENPYQLVDLVEGIGFYKADEIALKVGISKTSPIRIKALIMFNITKETYTNGDTYIEKSDLYEKSIAMINKEENIITKESFEKALESLAMENKIYIDKNNFISDIIIYRAEVRFAQRMFELLGKSESSKYSNENIINVLNKVENDNNIIYSKKQKDAIINAINEKVMIITGGPGTGKSTIVKAIIQTYIELEKNDLKENAIALLAPTGRAAKRLKEVTSHPNTMTIHRFLGYIGHGKFKYGTDLKVDSKFIIIDEFSMVDILLASRLFQAMEDDVKIIIVGDSDQLPSVSPGDVLNNLIESKEISTCKLTEIHRQASDSTIIRLAHSINEGYLPEDILEKKQDRNFIHISENTTSITNNVCSSIIKTIEQAIVKGMDLIKDIQVLIPMYKGELGIDNINNILQQKFNPKTEEIKHFNKSYRVDDKVIQLVNRSEKNVMNGDIGQIITLDKVNGQYSGLTVMFDFGPVYYTKDELEDITHAYAISIHKSQGSEFDLVIIPFTFKYAIMLKRKLIYTAITRAKRYLIMLGNVRSLERGISGIEENRKTRLTEMLRLIFSGNTNTKNINDIFNICDIFDDIEEDNNMENLSPYDFMN